MGNCKKKRCYLKHFARIASYLKHFASIASFAYGRSPTNLWKSVWCEQCWYHVCLHLSFSKNWQCRTTHESTICFSVLFIIKPQNPVLEFLLNKTPLSIRSLLMFTISFGIICLECCSMWFSLMFFKNSLEFLLKLLT